MKAKRPYLLAPLLTALSVSFVATPSGLVAQPDLKGLDAYVGQVRSTFEVPGLSVAVIQDGEIVKAKGYGVRSLETKSPVDEKTLFPIASNTKGMTGTALGILVDQGVIEWDQPVIELLPAFRLKDPYVTQQLTVRDLLVHRSGLGLGAGDLLFWPPTSLSRKEIVQRLRHLPLESSFRSRYAYDNVLYPVAGELIEAASGMTWEAFLTKSIFDKLDMSRTRPTARQADSLDNRASPHARIDGRVGIIQPFNIDNVAPAGGVHSSAADMAKWVKTLLKQGEPANSSHLVSQATAKALWTMVTPIPINSRSDTPAALRPNFLGYALGFAVRDYRGYKMVTHTGGLPGFVSQVTMLPQKNLGVVVLTNQESGNAFRSITHWIIDRILSTEDTDWLASFKASEEASRARLREQENEAPANRDETSRPSLPLDAYANTYTDPWYGEIHLKRTAENRLTIEFSHTDLLIGDLEHWQHDTFVIRWRLRELRADAFITFALNPDASIHHATMKAVSPATDFSYDFHDLWLTPDGKGN